MLGRVIMVTTKFNIRINMVFCIWGVWGLVPKYKLSIPENVVGDCKSEPVDSFQCYLFIYLFLNLVRQSVLTHIPRKSNLKCGKVRIYIEYDSACAS